MTTEQINRRFSELAGIQPILHDRYDKNGCLVQDEIFKDYCAHPDLVLDVMMPMEGFGDYLAYLCATNYNQCLGALVPVEYMRDKTGKFALLAIKWMEENDHA
jgi:hypothetical protein